MSEPFLQHPFHWGHQMDLQTGYQVSDNHSVRHFKINFQDQTSHCESRDKEEQKSCEITRII